MNFLFLCLVGRWLRAKQEDADLRASRVKWEEAVAE